MILNEFKDKVVVITGAASGIGRELGKLCAKRNMKVVLADINEKSVCSLEEDLKSEKKNVFSMCINVTSPESIESLAKKTIETFGRVDYLFNNAGIIWQKPVWDSTLTDWKRIIDINILGVIYGMKSFLPIMLEQNSGYIINTGSLSGIMRGELENSAYYGTKSAVIALTEAVRKEMEMSGTNVKISVLIPTLVATKLVKPKGDSELKSKIKVNNMFLAGASPEFVAFNIFEGIKENKLYIFPDPNVTSTFFPSDRTRAITRGIRASRKLNRRRN